MLTLLRLGQFFRPEREGTLVRMSKFEPSFFTCVYDFVILLINFGYRTNCSMTKLDIKNAILNGKIYQISVKSITQAKIIGVIDITTPSVKK